MAFQRRKPAATGVKAPLPGFIEPALASSIEKVPSGARWMHEIKFDGYRVQVHLTNESVKIFTRAATIGPIASRCADFDWGRGHRFRLARKGSYRSVSLI